MSKRVNEFFIIDILIAIDKIKRYTIEFENAQSFLHDEKSFDATIRELEIVGEATKHLIKSNLLKKNWQIVVDFRNIITHEYFGIDIDEVWEVITIHLIEFEKEIMELLKESDKNVINRVIESGMIDFKYNNKVIYFLIKLKDILKI